MELREFAAAQALAAVINRIDDKTKRKALEACGNDPDEAAVRMYENAAIAAVGFADALVARLAATIKP